MQQNCTAIEILLLQLRMYHFEFLLSGCRQSGEDNTSSAVSIHEVLGTALNPPSCWRSPREPNVSGHSRGQHDGAGDRRWLMIVEDQGGDYSGEAVNPRFLSLFENALGYGRRHQARRRIITYQWQCPDQSG